MYVKKMPFEESEFKTRLAKVQDEIAARKLDMLLIHTPENIFYLTGHHSAGYYMYTCLLVPAKGEPVLVLRYGEVGNAMYILAWQKTAFVVMMTRMILYLRLLKPSPSYANHLRKSLLKTVLSSSASRILSRCLPSCLAVSLFPLPAWWSSSVW